MKRNVGRVCNPPIIGADGLQTHPTVARRRGAVMAILIAVLVIVGVLAIGLTQLVVARHRLHLVQQRHQQTVELARAGARRAAAQLSRSPDYEGETWRVPADSIDGEDDASVFIEIASVEGDTELRSISARAMMGEGARRLQHTHEITVNLQTLKRE